jgi:mercuric ion transport protein
MDRLKGYVLLAVALVACPCHLPLLLALLGGTALGALLAAHLLPAGVLLGGVFVGAFAVGLRALESDP